MQAQFCQVRAGEEVQLLGMRWEQRLQKAACAGVSWNLVPAQVKLPCRLRTGSRSGLFLPRTGSATQGLGFCRLQNWPLLWIPSLSSFLFLWQQLLLQILAPKAQSRHATSNWRKITPRKSFVAQRTALAQGLPDLVSYFCQSWKL